MFDDLIIKKKKISRIYIINNKKCIINFKRKLIIVTKDFIFDDEQKLFDEIVDEYGKIFNNKWKMIKRERL